MRIASDRETTGDESELTERKYNVGSPVNTTTMQHERLNGLSYVIRPISVQFQNIR